ncbi:MAG: hypothetical protein R3A46_07720 [Thermomicrobiales bacterium]
MATIGSTIVPANVNVAGDANDPNGPTYATFTYSWVLFPSRLALR